MTPLSHPGPDRQHRRPAPAPERQQPQIQQPQPLPPMSAVNTPTVPQYPNISELDALSMHSGRSSAQSSLDAPSIRSMPRPTPMATLSQPLPGRARAPATQNYTYSNAPVPGSTAQRAPRTAPADPAASMDRHMPHVHVASNGGFPAPGSHEWARGI